MDILIKANHPKLIVKYDEIHGFHEGILKTAIDYGFEWILSQIQINP